MKKTAELLVELVEIIQTLRGPNGCPWDKKQTPKNVKEYLVEELYELLEAIDRDDEKMLAEEIGDLLFMVLFLVNLYDEKKAFTLGDSLAGIKKKMVHRHPHVFGDITVSSADEVKDNWQVLKEKEGKKPKTSFLDGIPKNLPALSRAFYLTSKAAEVGFDWKKPGDVLKKVKEEVLELETALEKKEKEALKDEIGDTLFSIVNLSRHLDIDPELALRGSNEKFLNRFSYIEKQLARQKKSLKEASLEEMDAIWEEAKKK